MLGHLILNFIFTIVRKRTQPQETLNLIFIHVLHVVIFHSIPAPDNKYVCAKDPSLTLSFLISGFTITSIATE